MFLVTNNCTIFTVIEAIKVRISTETMFLAAILEFQNNPHLVTMKIVTAYILLITMMMMIFTITEAPKVQICTGM